MSEEEKAKELVGKFKPLVIFTLTDGSVSDYMRNKCAKECALIAVEEILNLDVWDWPHNAEYGKIFWEGVKEKIQHLQL